ncbi:DUF397 domain-containing protein [Actinomadura sp. NPDC023710]|uniref:DUF397 domain-containing protein n=1 Tax=Actinomadura sp. NPDC023710 TaxID=3158219 RepID=UPI0033F023FE
MTKASDGTRRTWRTSSHSSTGNCVETARIGNQIAVRDSKNPALGMLLLTPSAFGDLLERIKR